MLRVRRVPIVLNDSVGDLQPIDCAAQMDQDYPLDLSISVSGGKETNKDSLSNGE